MIRNKITLCARLSLCQAPQEGNTVRTRVIRPNSRTLELPLIVGYAILLIFYLLCRVGCVGVFFASFPEGEFYTILPGCI